MTSNRGISRSGVSHIYLRLLRGEVTPERYVAVVKRAVRMRLRMGKLSV